MGRFVVSGFCFVYAQFQAFSEMDKKITTTDTVQTVPYYKERPKFVAMPPTAHINWSIWLYMKCHPRAQINGNGATTATFKFFSMSESLPFSALRIMRLFGNISGYGFKREKHYGGIIFIHIITDCYLTCPNCFVG